MGGTTISISSLILQECSIRDFFVAWNTKMGGEKESEIHPAETYFYIVKGKKENGRF